MQENNPIPTPVVTPEIVIEQPKNNNFLTVLLSVLLLLSVTIAGFFAFQTQKLVKELTMLKTESILTPEVTMEPTTKPVATSSPSPEPSLTPMASSSATPVSTTSPQP